MYNLQDASFYLLLMISISLLPLLASNFWHKFENVIITLLSISVVFIVFKNEGSTSATSTLAHVIISEYIPFIAIVFALYTTTGGIHLQLNIKNNMKNNIVILLFGAFIANFIGTTGASMLLIRPFLKLNKNASYKKHLCVFFVILVSNIGGCLTPLGDPPLFLGYLLGVDFFWTTKNLFFPFLIAIIFCTTIFVAIDRQKNSYLENESAEKQNIKFEGYRNAILILLIAIITLIAPKISENIVCELFEQKITTSQLVRDCSYITIGIVSFIITPKRIHYLHRFNFAPVIEVAKVFIAIFLTLIPINAMIKIGISGPLGSLLSFVTVNGVHDPVRYFWTSGILSAFLDNAPTYLLFFKVAGNDANVLMNNIPLLAAISLGSVFMGALTYIGNAPNIMVRNIAKQNNATMPSFLGYIVWSISILVPLFIIISLIIQYF